MGLGRAIQNVPVSASEIQSARQYTCIWLKSASWVNPGHGTEIAHRALGLNVEYSRFLLYVISAICQTSRVAIDPSCLFSPKQVRMRSNLVSGRVDPAQK